MQTQSKAVIEVTDANFGAEIERLPGLAVVDFGAEWCGPCRMMAPIVEQLAEAYAGRVRLGKLDVDANPGAATTYGVRNLPTFLFFKDGKRVDAVIGAVPRSVLERKIEQHLG